MCGVQVSVQVKGMRGSHACFHQSIVTCSHDKTAGPQETHQKSNSQETVNVITCVHMYVCIMYGCPFGFLYVVIDKCVNTAA